MPDGPQAENPGQIKIIRQSGPIQPSTPQAASEPLTDSKVIRQAGPITESQSSTTRYRRRDTQGHELLGSLSDMEIDAITFTAGTFKRQEAQRAEQKQVPLGEIDFGAVYDPSYLAVAIENIDPQIAENFTAHGIAKGSVKDQIQSLDNWLSRNGPDPSRNWVGVARLSDQELYDTGGFIVLSHTGESLNKGIAAVLVNREFASSIPLLKQKFPNVRFVETTTNVADTTKRMELELKTLK